MKPSYVVGLDLGQTSDFSALAVLESAPGPSPVRAVRYLHRWPRGTPYTAPPLGGVCEQVAELVLREPLPGCVLAVDQTGVGRAVVDVLRLQGMPATLFPITITPGSRVTQEEDGSLHVPKKDLVACLQVLLQSSRLQIAGGLPLADTLRQELESFRVKVTAAGNETFSAWRERDHDDLVLAVALACWLAERFPALDRHSIGTGGRPAAADLRSGDFRRPLPPM